MIVMVTKEVNGTMSEPVTSIQVGQPVPEFKLTAFDPTAGDFKEISLSQIRQAGKWTILFFYPADFTFV